jgi:hypothetical protein
MTRVNPCRFSTASRWSPYTFDADMDDHFYVTLPSNDVKLPERICLDDEYELGVTEIVYPRTWYNVDNDGEKCWIGAYDVVTNQFPFLKMYPKSGFYDDGGTLASSLTHQVARAFADIPGITAKFTFDKCLDRISMQIFNSPETTVIFSADLLEFMGFPRKMIVLKELDRVGSKPFDVNRGLMMYVYGDIASHGIVDDTKTPLLHVFNPVGRHGDLVRLTYDRSHYVPIGRRDFDRIAITINNELGEPISIRSGQFFTTLHIRRRR